MSTTAPTCDLHLQQEASAKRFAASGQYLEALDAYSALLLVTQCESCVRVDDGNDDGERGNDADDNGTLARGACDGRMSRLLANRALMYKKLGDTDASMSDSREALQLDADNHKARFRLAQCLQDKFEFDNALEQLSLLRQRVCNRSTQPVTTADTPLAPTRASAAGWLRVVGEKETEIRRMSQMREPPRLDDDQVAAWMSQDHTLRLNWKTGPPVCINTSTPFQVSIYACTEFGFFPRGRFQSTPNNDSTINTVAVFMDAMIAGRLPHRSTQWKCLLSHSPRGPWQTHTSLGTGGRAVLWCQLVSCTTDAANLDTTLSQQGDVENAGCPDEEEHLQFLCQAAQMSSPLGGNRDHIIPVLSLPTVVSTTTSVAALHADSQRLNTNCRFVGSYERAIERNTHGTMKANASVVSNASDSGPGNDVDSDGDGVALIERAESLGIPGKVWDGALALLEFLRTRPQFIRDSMAANSYSPVDKSVLARQPRAAEAAVCIVELGAGTGAVSIGLAKTLQLATTTQILEKGGVMRPSYQIICTDLGTVVPLIQENINLNGFGGGLASDDKDNTSGTHVHDSAKSGTSVHDSAKSVTNVHDSVDSVTNVHDSAKSGTNVHDSVASTQLQPSETSVHVNPTPVAGDSAAISQPQPNPTRVCATTASMKSPHERVSVVAATYEWGSTSRADLCAAATSVSLSAFKVDLIVMSDVVYAPEFYSPLIASLLELCSSASTHDDTIPNSSTTGTHPPDGSRTVVLMAHRQRNPDDYKFFLEVAQYFNVRVLSGPRLNYRHKSPGVREQLEELLGSSVVLTKAHGSSEEEHNNGGVVVSGDDGGARAEEEAMGQVVLLQLTKKE